MQEKKQIWIALGAHERICEYCKRNDTKKQAISSKAILLGMRELERQEAALKEGNK